MSSEVEIKITPYNPDWYPPCFNNQEQFNDYAYMIRRVGQPMDNNNYCMDCTKEYQAEMACEGKCEHPETKFVVWRTTYKDPEVVGKIVSNLNEPDIIGISNISKFWGSPSLDEC
jgi:hypothetical protein